ncbi:hypothetical protein OF83DRAFT_121336 [Amylostereum chailletii]|nr:hypothetical protein OF83DRAFT_121336 [Amylostereum chailletii]
MRLFRRVVMCLHFGRTSTFLLAEWGNSCEKKRERSRSRQSGRVFQRIVAIKPFHPVSFHVRGQEALSLHFVCEDGMRSASILRPRCTSLEPNKRSVPSERSPFSCRWSGSDHRRHIGLKSEGIRWLVSPLGLFGLCMPLLQFFPSPFSYAKSGAACPVVLQRRTV